MENWQHDKSLMDRNVVLPIRVNTGILQQLLTLYINLFILYTNIENDQY